jgi:RNA polymerase sigma-70 factor (ECF subfamily)
MTKEEEFAEYYAAHYRQVRGFCRQLLGSTEQGEDAAQEAFVRAYRAFAQRDPAQPFIAWIMRIARNHCLDLLRRRRHEPALFGDETLETAAAEAPDAGGLLRAALTMERAAAVNAAVAKLPERYRVPLALAYYADADYDDIATTLAITRNHVGVLLCRAKQLLRRSLAGEDEDAASEASRASAAPAAAGGGRALSPKETL